MKMEEGMQLIDGNGKFNVEGLQDFMTTTEFAQSGLSYAIVAIIGPQSSGKSTLLNHTFHTNFKEMDAYEGRGQTTKGIWIAKCSDMDPFTIVMDFEGTDSNQRGESAGPGTLVKVAGIVVAGAAAVALSQKKQ